MANKRFGMVHSDVIYDPDLSIRAKGIYSVLCTFADRSRRCYPSIKTISELSGVSRRTVERIIKELEEKNYVTRKGRVFTLN